MFGESEPPRVLTSDNNLFYWEEVSCFWSNTLRSLIGSILGVLGEGIVKFVSDRSKMPTETYPSTSNLMLAAAWNELTVFSGRYSDVAIWGSGLK